MDYYEKYLKYKNKYLEFKNKRVQTGGVNLKTKLENLNSDHVDKTFIDNLKELGILLPPGTIFSIEIV
jgi:hypothetical protein